MRKKINTLLVIFLPAGIVLIIAGALLLTQPKRPIERITTRTATIASAATSTLAQIFTYTANPATPQAPAETSAATQTAGIAQAALTLSTTAQLTPASSTSLTPTVITKTSIPTQTPCLNCTATPSYLSTLVSVMKTIAGEWRGATSVTVNRQARPYRAISLTLYASCVSGQVCGEYHDESSCSGFLTFQKLRGSTYIFASHPLTNVEKCNPGGFFYLKPKADGNLALTISIRDLDGRTISRSATLTRKQ